MFSSAASKAEAEPSSSRRSSTGPSALPNAHSQYNAAVAATAAAVTPSLRAPPAPAPPREKFADLKWMWSRTIQSPSGTPLTREQIERKVLAGPRVLAAIERITSDAHSGVAGGPAAGNTMSREEASKAAKANFAGMYADVSQTVIRSSIYVMRKVWRTMYEGIRVNEEGIERLHEYAHAKVPVVLMPMHKVRGKEQPHAAHRLPLACHPLRLPRTLTTFLLCVAFDSFPLLQESHRLSAADLRVRGL